MNCPYCSGEQTAVALNKHYAAQLEAWREVAGLLAYALQAPHLSTHHPAGNAYHARGTALESYERLKSNGTAFDL